MPEHAWSQEQEQWVGEEQDWCKVGASIEKV
jgi:hypothetical protein